VIPYTTESELRRVCTPSKSITMFHSEKLIEKYSLKVTSYYPMADTASLGSVDSLSSSISSSSSSSWACATSPE